MRKKRQTEKLSMQGHTKPLQITLVSAKLSSSLMDEPSMKRMRWDKWRAHSGLLDTDHQLLLNKVCVFLSTVCTTDFPRWYFSSGGGCAALAGGHIYCSLSLVTYCHIRLRFMQSLAIAHYQQNEMNSGRRTVTRNVSLILASFVRCSSSSRKDNSISQSGRESIGV